MSDSAEGFSKSGPVRAATPDGVDCFRVGTRIPGLCYPRRSSVTSARSNSQRGSHVFELSKDAPPSDNRVIDDPIDQWLCLFRQADEATVVPLTTWLPDPVFAEATGVLEMIAKDPEERRLYNARLKMELDERVDTHNEVGCLEQLQQNVNIRLYESTAKCGSKRRARQ